MHADDMKCFRKASVSRQEVRDVVLLPLQVLGYGSIVMLIIVIYLAWHCFSSGLPVVFYN